MKSYFLLQPKLKFLSDNFKRLYMALRLLRGEIERRGFSTCYSINRLFQLENYSTMVPRDQRPLKK